MKSIVIVAVLLFGSAVIALAGDNPRVYVEDSSSWKLGSGAGGVDGTFGASGGGGARPQTAEIIKTFGQRCPNVVINDRKDKADYVVLLQHEGGKSIVVRDNKVVVFNRDGDSILSDSTRSLGNSVTNACTAIMKDWTANPKSVNASATQATSPDNGAGKIQVTSTPAGADIKVNGAFMGSTPSVLRLAPGDYTITVEKAGYTSWQRQMKVTGGDVNLVAELQPGK